MIEKPELIHLRPLDALLRLENLSAAAEDLGVRQQAVSALSNQLTISAGQHSCQGRKNVNQDFHGIYLAREPRLGYKGIAIALADGISGSDVSQVASQFAVTGFLEDYYCTSKAWSVKTSAERVRAAHRHLAASRLRRADAAVWNAVARDGARTAADPGLLSAFLTIRCSKDFLPRRVTDLAAAWPARSLSPGSRVYTQPILPILKRPTWRSPLSAKDSS